jgi:hypothetical protein
LDSKHRQGLVLDHLGRPVGLDAGDAFLHRGVGGIGFAAADNLVVTGLEIEIGMAILGGFLLVALIQRAVGLLVRMVSAFAAFSTNLN